MNGPNHVETFHRTGSGISRNGTAGAEPPDPVGDQRQGARHHRERSGRAMPAAAGDRLPPARAGHGDLYLRFCIGLAAGVAPAGKYARRRA